MMENQHYPFTLPLLSYPYQALEPNIDQETMHYHYDKHFQAYIDNLNKTLLMHPAYQRWTLTQLLCNLSQLPKALQTPIRNNAGGVYNHDLYFDCLAPQTGVLPAGLRTALEQRFGSLGAFADHLKAAALRVFGSGYAWLALDPENTLQILTLPNQDNPLTYGLFPLLPMDVWEHAYYLKHQNRRANYIDNWFGVVNWSRVADRLAFASRYTHPSKN